jgi:uncharacterized protein (DUF1800 family)
MQSEIAVLRFGLGARPGELKRAAADPRGWLREQLRGPVTLSSSLRLAPSDEILSSFLAARAERRQRKKADAAAGETAESAINAVKEAYLPHYRAQVLARAQSAAATARPFAERLTHFWANHFAVSADKGIVTGIAGTLENEAIRPHVCGRFQDMLTAVEKHPAMIAFLDNQASVGPNSRAAQFAGRRSAGRQFAAPGGAQRQIGINENLAREIMELHTLGVHGGYSQTDVTTFAKVLTGWSIGGMRGQVGGGIPGRFFFRENLHEPGAQTMLGRTFREDGVEQGEAVLAALAHHSSTAQFLATKLVRHFVADDPPAALVDRVAEAYRGSGGFLPDVYQALLSQDAAWETTQQKFKTPQDLVFSTLRAFDAVPVDPQEPLRSFEFLGQRQFTPGSPAGWPDNSRSWDGSDALLHRVVWATRVGERFEQGTDPILVSKESLGRYARPETLASVQRAASASQALALMIMSPEFQRR